MHHHIMSPVFREWRGIDNLVCYLKIRKEACTKVLCVAQNSWQPEIEVIAELLFQDATLLHMNLAIFLTTVTLSFSTHAI